MATSKPKTTSKSKTASGNKKRPYRYVSANTPMASQSAITLAMERCKVCNSPHLEEINNILRDSGLSIDKVRTYCIDTWGETFTPRSLSNHRGRHLNIQDMPVTTEEIVAQVSGAVQVKSVQADINRKFDEGEIDVHNGDAMLNHMITKSLHFIRMIEAASPQQISHQNIQKYMHEIRECIKLLRGEAENVNVVNVQMVNTEVVSILRTVADVVREIIPEKYGVFMDKLKDKIRATDATIVNNDNPIEPLPMTITTKSGTATVMQSDEEDDENDD